VAERALLAREPWIGQRMKNAAARRSCCRATRSPPPSRPPFARVRARLLAIPTKAAPQQVVLLKTVAEVTALLTALIHEALQELSETEVVPAVGDAPTRDEHDDDDLVLGDNGGAAEGPGPEHG
jgi:hypothetical protein